MCGVRTDGRVACWGDGTKEATAAPSGEFTRVAAGWHMSCAIKRDRTVVCWGKGTEAGRGPLVAPVGTFADVVVGIGNACGMRTDGRPVCWPNPAGGVGWPVGPSTAVTMGGSRMCSLFAEGYARCEDLESPIRTDLKLTAIDLDESAGCGIDAAGAVHCGGKQSLETLPSPTGTFRQVSVGWQSGCGVRSDSTLGCWGKTMPTLPSGEFIQVETTGSFGCGLRANGEVACWGTTYDTKGPPAAGPFSAITVGFSHVCALRPDGTVACWGSDFYGQSTPPTDRFTRITAGSGANCGIRPDKTLACWGGNKMYADFAKVPPGEFKDVAIGNDNTACAVNVRGGVYCCGMRARQPYDLE